MSAVVLHVLAPMREGGLERVVQMMAARQRPSGVRVACVLEPGEMTDHPFVAQLEQQGVEVNRIAARRRDYIAEYRAIFALIQRLRPRVVHTHGYRSDIFGGRAARTAKIPVVSTAHGFTGGGLRNHVYEMLQCRALRRADAVIAVSTPIVERLVRAGVPKSKIREIQNGFTALQPSLSRTGARQRLGISTDALVVGWVGRLSTEKGPDVMLDALARTSDEWQLAVIGDGPLRMSLERQAERLNIARRVRWCGAIPNAGTLFTAFDAFALTSRTEGTPISLLEAMNSQLPIVATAVGGVPAVISAREAWLVPSEEPLSVSDALAHISSDPRLAADTAAAANQRLHTSFNIDDWLASVEQAYRLAEENFARAVLSS